MASTEMIMAPTLPQHAGLEPIGSVAANFARTDEDERRDEYVRFAYRSQNSEYALQTYGLAVHDKLLARWMAEREEAKLEEERRRERCRSLRKGVRKFFRRLNCFAPSSLVRRHP